MNKDMLKGKLKNVKDKIKQPWGESTDDEIIKTNGNYDKLERIIQKKYWYEKEDAVQEIGSFLIKLN